MQTCWLLTEQTDWTSREHWWDCGLHFVNAPRWGFIPISWMTGGAVNFQPGMCSVSLSLSEIYEMNNLHPSTMCWTAELHMTRRNTTYSGEVLSIDLASRKLPGNFRLPWGHTHCACHWFHRISLMVSDAFIISILHGNREYLFSYLHCLQAKSHRIWDKPLSSSFMWCLDIRWRSRCE